MSGSFFWRRDPVPFEPGETIAAALRRAGILDLGPSGTAVHNRVFCGIGTCQSCIVAIEGGTPVEACLTLAEDGMRIEPVIPGPPGGHHG
jgi:aerobic-type carbon monoxide dehydrogenase small subunit (CoxS/CutS family)